ncbi:YjdF family protein [Paenibacillus hexagrammi]|uniref:YjdF family protein n=1 Tax=Paenibacillus hexagrammi TaxID=2908839 RepID=A0ABY3SEE4_9BACL|nr:YjdF family protein [Paenibacillus sp. YPD9-1]UJF31521.1 YjdF family protein [Paenibacillus sp. YPD9-1]
MKLTVFFEQPFWVGVVEEERNGRLRAVRYVFGSEPYDAEVLDFVNTKMTAWLERVQRSTEVAPLSERKLNPKRIARLAAKELERRGVSSAAQEALKLELEHRKKERKVVSREQREAAKEMKREMARLKAKAKHRGK